MLGCIGVAPDSPEAPTSGPAGAYGGNMDYKEIREGAQVITAGERGRSLSLPGRRARAGRRWRSGRIRNRDLARCAVHGGAAQESELNRILASRTSEYIISIGARTASNHSLNDALTIANSDMMRWLVEEYGIEPVAAHLLIGHQAKYDVAALSGVMAMKIPKRALLEDPLMKQAVVPSRIEPNRMPREYGNCARLPAAATTCSIAHS